MRCSGMHGLGKHEGMRLTKKRRRSAFCLEIHVVEWTCIERVENASTNGKTNRDRHRNQEKKKTLKPYVCAFRMMLPNTTFISPCSSYLHWLFLCNPPHDSKTLNTEHQTRPPKSKYTSPPTLHHQTSAHISPSPSHSPSQIQQTSQTPLQTPAAARQQRSQLL